MLTARTQHETIGYIVGVRGVEESEMKINHLKYIPLANFSSVYGTKLTDTELQKTLARVDCQQALVILSRLASIHIAICEHNDDAAHLMQHLRELHTAHIYTRGGNPITYMRFEGITSPQSIFILEKWVLNYCSIEKEFRAITVADVMCVMDALLAINDRLPSDIDGHETEYLYLTLYYNTHRVIKNQIARSFYVFSVLSREEPEMTDLLNGYVQKRGFSIEERLTVLFNQLGSVIPQFTNEEIFSHHIFTKAAEFDARELFPVYDRIMEDICDDYKRTRRRAKKTLDKVWDFELFYRYPFIRIGDVRLSLSETAVVYQMWDGLYWSVRFAFEHGDKTFMIRFGRPFERYVQIITEAAIKESNGRSVFQGEFFYKYEGDLKASTDCYFRIGNTLFAVEAKAKSPQSSTLTGVDRAAIEEEVHELMIAPISQALSRLKEITSDSCDVCSDIKNIFEGVEQTVIFSVSMEKVQPIGDLLFELDAALKPDLNGTNVVAYHNINIEEYEFICNLLETCPSELTKILVDWFTDQRKDIRSAVALANFLSDCGKPCTCSQYVSSLFKECMRDISLKTFGKDMTTELSF